MSTLVMMSGHRTIHYTLFNGERPATMTGGARDVQQVARQIVKRGEAMPETIALRALFGGSEFKAPTIVTPEVEETLRRMSPQSPLHMARTLSTLEDCRETFPGATIVLVFETSFFASLPEREAACGLDPEVMKKLSLRRYGYHGIYHQAACDRAIRICRAQAPYVTPRILSICLEPKPEVAASVGSNPVMVTSGATPLEGLPGETSCGEIDPSLVLTIAEKKNWGPEQIDAVLTKESGMLGLAGRRVTLEDVFLSDKPELKPVREIMEYRIRLACGAGVAAMGGVDSIVFSGRYAVVGELLGPRLASRLTFRGNPAPKPISWECFLEPLARIIADNALSAAVSMEELGAREGL